MKAVGSEKQYQNLYILLGGDVSRAIALLEETDRCCPQVREACAILREGLARAQRFQYEKS